MDRLLVRNVLTIFMESPIYLAMSVKERYRLISYFISSYSPLLSKNTDQEPGPSGDSVWEPQTPDDL